MGEFNNTLQEAIDGGLDNGLKNYPIFNETYRDTLNAKITEHYLYYELGFETEARFVHRINNFMNETMPYFNKLYESELLTINPLLTFSRTENGTAENTLNTSGSSNGEQGRTINVEETSTNEGTENKSNRNNVKQINSCLLYTSDAADE